MEKMKELYDKVAKDSSLQSKFQDIMSNAEKEAETTIDQKLVSFAKEAGYDVTSDEIKSFFGELSEQKRGALSDDELDLVAGGKKVTLGIVMSVTTYGVGCAVMSATKEIGGDSCKGYLDTDLDSFRSNNEQ